MKGLGPGPGLGPGESRDRVRNKTTRDRRRVLTRRRRVRPRRVSPSRHHLIYFLYQARAQAFFSPESQVRVLPTADRQPLPPCASGLRSRTGCSGRGSNPHTLRRQNLKPMNDS